MIRRFLCLLGCLAVLSCPTTLAEAALLAYDPIDTSATGDPPNGLYKDGVAIRKFSSGTNTNYAVENGNIVGFAASTTTGGHDWGTTNTALFIANGSAGLTAPGADYASGGAIRYSGYNDTTSRGIQRQFLDSVPRRPTANNESLYFSFLLQAVGTDSDGQAMVGFSDSTTVTTDLLSSTETYGPIVGFKGDGSNTDLIYRHRTATNTLSDLVLVDGVTAGATYQVVAKITANTNTFYDDFSIFVNPTTATEPSTPSFSGQDASIGTAAFQQMDRLLLATNNFADAVIFDEFRYGTTWQDVVAIAPIPEPSTLLIWSLLAGLGVGLGWRRRTK